MKSSNSERVKNEFDVVCSIGDSVHLVNIYEIDMGGWTLFECHFLWSGDVVYFSQEAEGEPLEYIEMEEEVPQEWTAPLLHAIRQQKAA